MKNRPASPSSEFSDRLQGVGSCLSARSSHDKRRKGFALVTVIWTLGLITLLGTAVIIGARYRTRLTSSHASVLAAATAAESAVSLGIVVALMPASAQSMKFPLKCRLPGGERVTVTLEEETGKIDLNAATLAVLTRFFTALTVNQSLSIQIAQRIIEFREQVKGQTSDASFGTNKPSDDSTGRFTTIMQLDQIDGVSPDLFRAAARFVTVRSGRPEPDKDAASPALRQILNLEQNPTTPARGSPAIGYVTISADVRAPDGTRFIRDALISLGSKNGRAYVIREWRRGEVVLGAPFPGAQSNNNTQALERECFRGAGATEVESFG